MDNEIKGHIPTAWGNRFKALLDEFRGDYALVASEFLIYINDEEKRLWESYEKDRSTISDRVMLYD